MTSDKESHLQKLKGAKTIACALSAKIQKKTSLLKNAYIFLLEAIFFFFFHIIKVNLLKVCVITAEKYRVYISSSKFEGGLSARLT